MATSVTQIMEMINEEVDKMIDAFKENEKESKKIENKLEELRKKVTKEGEIRREALGEDALPRQEKHMQLQLVSEITDIPVNELMLYFLNTVKAKNERSLVEYHLGHVYFYSN